MSKYRAVIYIGAMKSSVVVYVTDAKDFEEAKAIALMQVVGGIEVLTVEEEKEKE